MFNVSKEGNVLGFLLYLFVVNVENKNVEFLDIYIGELDVEIDSRLEERLIDYDRL